MKMITTTITAAGLHVPIPSDPIAAFVKWYNALFSNKGVFTPEWQKVTFLENIIDRMENIGFVYDEPPIIPAGRLLLCKSLYRKLQDTSEVTVGETGIERSDKISIWNLYPDPKIYRRPINHIIHDCLIYITNTKPIKPILTLDFLKEVEKFCKYGRKYQKLKMNLNSFYKYVVLDPRKGIPYKIIRVLENDDSNRLIRDDIL